MKNRKKSISFYTMGCRSNQAETAVLTNLFEQNDYKIVDCKEPSDIAVINTCTVTQKADADTRRLINRILRVNPKTKIALVGCQAEVQKDKLTSLPSVKWIVGNQKKLDLVSILDQTKGATSPEVITPPIEVKAFSLPVAGIDRRHTRANIKIQDGCDCFCSYCEVPYARGGARSRKFPDIIKEAKALAAAQHQELIITGINVGKYKYENKTILDVISAIEQIPGVSRIRVSSIEPTSILPKLIKKMAQKDTKLCRFLHIPIQSANDNILKAMGRTYTSEKVLSLMKEAKSENSDICIGTDIIIGFPGEDETSFKDTYKKIKESPIDYFHVFSYSERTMAKAKELPGKVSSKGMKKRSLLLRNLGKEKRRSFYRSMIDKNVTVLFEQKRGKHWKGLTDNYIHVKAISKENLTNQFKNVNLKKFDDQDILGVII